jgi:hypothetical protein
LHSCHSLLLVVVLPAGYVTPGLTFVQQNKRLYEASINTQLDEIFNAVMTKQTSSSSTADADEDSLMPMLSSSTSRRSSSSTGDSTDGGTVNVAKSAKVAAFLMLGLLMQAGVPVIGQ